jgi:two-component system, OmpR family, phosphate regulon sensor histidine kinase PhoR
VTGLQLAATIVGIVLILGQHAGWSIDSIWGRLIVGLLIVTSVGVLFSQDEVVLESLHSTEVSTADREFVATVSHELRTPLTSIQGYAETLELDLAQGRSSDALQAITVIRSNCARLLALCGDLLSLARIDQEPISKEQCSVRNLVSEVVASVEPQRLARGHTIGQSIQCETIWVDQNMAAQVLTNLLENAIRYLPQMGTIEIDVASNPSTTLLSVRDNGPGIAPEHHVKLFEKFYRVDRGRSRAEGGTGLGLAVVKQIMSRHGGRVWLESRLGEGSTFYCEFPNKS